MASALPLPHLRPLAFVLLPLLPACSAAGPDMVSVRDSAGIEIVEHAPEALERAERWETAAEPVLRIGVVDGDPAYQLFQVADALELDDGRVVVVDRGARQLRLYDRTGAFLTAHGREGEGPGEYRRPEALWRLPGDSLAVYDAALSRVTVLSDRLAFGRIVRLPDATAVGLQLQQGETDGGLLVGRQEPILEGIVPLTLWRLGVGEPAMDSLTTVPGSERVARRWPIYGWTTRAAVAGDRLVVGTGLEHEVREYALADGATLRRLIRWPGTPDPVTGEDWEAYFRGYVERTRTRPEGEAALRRSLQDVPVAERKPAYNEVMLDGAGNLWLRDYEFPWRLVPPETGWTVFDDEGRLRARAVLPAGFRPFEIGEDRVLGVQHDESDVQRVVILELEKSRT